MTVHPKNFRDVGEYLGLWLDPSPVPRGRLLRGGAFDVTFGPADLGSPRTVLNLRRGPDPTHLEGVALVQCANDDLEVYETRLPKVRRWLARALAALTAAAPPVYVHCTSGRDRTGVVVAAALVLSDVAPEVAAEEYMLSHGADAARIEGAIEGILAHRAELDGPAVRRWLLDRPTEER